MAEMTFICAENPNLSGQHCVHVVRTEKLPFKSGDLPMELMRKTLVTRQCCWCGQKNAVEDYFVTNHGKKAKVLR